MNHLPLNIAVVNALKNTKGIAGATPVTNEDREQILICERKAEKRSLMGLGKVINTGVREILKCEAVYVALTQMSFDWGCQATLLLKKEDQIVGEEVRDEARLLELGEASHVWIMHKNFVIYKDRIDFPRDVVQKICHFEIPGLAADWFRPGKAAVLIASANVAVPSTLGDVFLKERYFDNCDEHGTGTLLMGIDCHKRPGFNNNRISKRGENEQHTTKS